MPSHTAFAGLSVYAAAWRLFALRYCAEIASRSVAKPVTTMTAVEMRMAMERTVDAAITSLTPKMLRTMSSATTMRLNRSLFAVTV